MSDDMLAALTPPLHCASILQPATPLQVVTFESCIIKNTLWVRENGMSSG